MHWPPAQPESGGRGPNAPGRALPKLHANRAKVHPKTTSALIYFHLDHLLWEFTGN